MDNNAGVKFFAMGAAEVGLSKGKQRHRPVS